MALHLSKPPTPPDFFEFGIADGKLHQSLTANDVHLYLGFPDLFIISHFEIILPQAEICVISVTPARKP
jgi:hypothetical protein